MGTKFLKASFQGAGKFKNAFASAKCLVPISVGQFYHENNYLMEHIKLVNANFSSCHIIVCDSLQRHTLSFYEHNYLGDKCYALSLENGKAWFERNCLILDTLEIPTSISYWDFWLDQPQYHISKAQINTLMAQDITTREVFTTTAERFVTKLVERTNTILTDHQISSAKQSSLEYPIEECAVTAVWIKLDAEFISYPGSPTPAMAAAIEVLVKIHYPKLLNWLRVNFRHKHQIPSVLI